MNTPDMEQNIGARLVLTGYEVSGNCPSKGRLDASAYMKATAKCPSISAILLIYNSSGKVIDRATEVEYNTKSVSADLHESGLSAGTYTIYGHFHVNYPEGEEESSDTASKTGQVIVN